MNDVRALVGANLRYYRKKAGLTQEHLADLAKSSNYYISCLERGKENVGIDTLQRLCKPMKIDTHLLFLPPEKRED
jgi:transcriptional regulator with XRE-family HTH domain